MRRIVIVSAVLLALMIVGYLLYQNPKKEDTLIGSVSLDKDGSEEIAKTHPLQIVQMRENKYPGSELNIEKTLSAGNGFSRYVASYYSEGFKINGLLAVPDGKTPQGGWPAIIFNHGYIKPEEYRRESKYVSYISGFAGKGYVVFMPDYRGHQDSEGIPLGAYFSTAYATDSLNAFYSLQKYPNVNPDKMGMWGHSMGGNITLRSMVVSKDIKVGVIWAGVVASYEDMSTKWRRTQRFSPSSRENMSDRPGRGDLEKEYGSVSDNESFWRSISPIYFVSDISGPLQLHHGTNDDSVPWEFSESLKNALESASKTVEYHLYPGSDHNISQGFSLAMNRSVVFFDKYLKDVSL